MRPLILVALLIVLLVSAWAGVRGTDLPRTVPVSMGSMRAYCDTGHGIFLPCASVELDSAKT